MHIWRIGLSAILLFACSASATQPSVAKKVARADGGEELLANPGLDVIDGKVKQWPAYDAGFAIDANGGRDGGACIVCDNPDGKKKMGLSQTLRLDRKVVRPLLVSGWSKAVEVTGSSNLEYSIYADLEYSDGTTLWAQVAQFTTGTHDWEEQKVRILPEKPVRTLTVYGLFRQRQGKVFFDDISVQELGGENGCIAFDGACVQPVGDAVAGEASIQIRDVAADSDFFALPATEGEVEVAPLGLTAAIHRETSAEGIRTLVTLKDLSGQDRAITLYYAVAIDAAGWEWFDNVRQHRTIKPPHDYSNTFRPGVGATGRTSRYPFACIAGAEQARSLLVTEASVFHLGYHAGTRELYAAFDIGLSSMSKVPGTATVAVVDARTDPKWGMRDTARLFYRLLPRWFDPSRVPRRQGNWMAFQAISSLAKPEDFHFAVHEGNNDVRWDNDHGVLPFVYVEPMSFWMAMPKETPRTYEAAMAQLRSLQADAKAPQHRIARAVEASCIFDRDGRYHVDILNAPWCDGAVFGNSPDPDVPQHEGSANIAHHHLTELERASKNAESQGGLAGVYLDSLEGWGTLLNFRREHFAAADLPLTFDAGSHRPVILNAFATQEWTQFIADKLHAEGKLLMANAVPHEYPFLALPCDLLGTESNWQRDGRFAPPGPDFFYIKRTLSWKKPYMFLMNTHFETWTAEMTERYMQMCLFYGMFPGFFSENAATNCYFQNAAWYDRDRPLFRKYMPLIRKVAEAGWEPIPLARADRDDVWIERWGGNSAGDTYLTVMNTTNEPRKASIQLDDALGSPAKATLLIASQPADTSDAIVLDLPPQGVEVIQIR